MQAIPDNPARPWSKAWNVRSVALLLGLLALAAWTSREALFDLLSIGLHKREQSHILLAPFVAVWLFWFRVVRLRQLPVARSAWGPALIACGWFTGWWGDELDAQVMRHVGALVTLLGALVTMTGLAIVRQFAPAFAALLFMIPVPGAARQALAGPLQAMATEITHGMLELIGAPAARMGHVLLINGEQVAVGEACNGMRMVFAMMLIIYAFTFSLPLRIGTRLLLLALSPVTALLSNVLRLLPTSLFFGYGTLEQAEVFHDIAGWIMLPVAIFMLLGVVRLIRWLELPVMSLRLVTR